MISTDGIVSPPLPLDPGTPNHFSPTPPSLPPSLSLSLQIIPPTLLREPFLTLLHILVEEQRQVANDKREHHLREEL